MELHIERRGDGPLLVCHPGGPGFGAGYFTGMDEEEVREELRRR